MRRQLAARPRETWVHALDFIGTVLYCTVLYCAVLYCTLLYWVHALDFIGGMPSLDTVFQSYEQFLGKNKECPTSRFHLDGYLTYFCNAKANTS